MSGFCCVSSVPASCVHIWFVSCPCFMSLWVKYVPAVFMWLCVNYPVYLVPVFWVWFRLVYSLLPRCILSLSPALSCLVLPCPALSCLVLPWCLIKDYYLSLCPRLRVPVPPYCVHRDRRPDLNSKWRPFTSFCFRFWKFYFVPVFVSVPQQGSRRSSSRLSPRQVGVGVRWDRREWRESVCREPSSPPIVGDHTAVRGSQPRR